MEVAPPRVVNNSPGGADDVESKSIPIAKVVFNSRGIPVIEERLEIDVKSAEQVYDYFASLNPENSQSEHANILRAHTSVDRNLLDKSGWFWHALDQNSRQMQSEANLPEILLGSSAAIASSMTVGYLVWLIKGGQVAAAVMANMPAWRLIDPLPILTALIEDDEVEDDSLESIITHGEDELDN